MAFSESDSLTKLSLQLHQHLQQQLTNGPPATEYLVAYSTGPDSTALLHALSRLKIKQSIRAIHVNHGLQAEAADWAKLARANCADWNIPLQLEHVSITRDGYGLEAAARDARYNTISQHAGRGTVVLTAHHADDQVETLLLNLLRGSGLRGLSGMPKQRTLGNYVLFRPLLELPGSKLRDYCTQSQLLFSEDNSNQNLNFDRNWLRNELLPLIERRFPGAQENFTISAQLLGQSLLLNQQFIQQQLDKLMTDDQLLDLQQLTDYPVFFQYEIVREFITALAIWPPPPGQRLTEFIRQLNQAQSGKSPVLTWNSHSLRVYQSRLYMVDKNSVTPITNNHWQQAGDWVWPDIGRIQINLPDTSSSLHWPALEVYQRAGGEQIKLDDGHHHRLKKLYQQAGIPPWERDRLPLIYHRKKLIAVADKWLHPAFRTWLEKRAIGWQWQPIK